MKKIFLALLLLSQVGCTGSGAVNPLSPANASKVDPSSAPADSDVLYWSLFPLASPITDALNGICMLSKKNGWACGNNGIILKYDGETWAKVETGLAKSENLFGVAFANENEGWMVGSHGTILSYKSGTWNQETSPTQESLFAVAVTRSRSVWAVGTNGTLLSYNGISWGKVVALADAAGAAPTTVMEDLYSLSLSDQNNGWAVGNRGTILRFDGQKWQPFAVSPSIERLNSVSVVSDVQAWIVGAFGTILRFNGTTWNKMGTAFSGFDLYQVSMKSDDDGWAVGQDGTLIYYDGTRWIAHQKIQGKPSLNALSFYKDTGFAVGQNGTILKFQPNGELSKFSFIFKGAMTKKPSSSLPFWTLTYSLMNQSPKASAPVTFEMPIPKGFEPYQKKDSMTATPTAVVTAVPTMTPTPAATPSASPVATHSVPTALSGIWKMKDGNLQWEIGTVAASEMKTITILLREKQGEKKELPVILKAVLKGLDKVAAEAAPVTLVVEDPALPANATLLTTPIPPANTPVH